MWNQDPNAIIACYLNGETVWSDVAKGGNVPSSDVHLKNRLTLVRPKAPVIADTLNDRSSAKQPLADAVRMISLVNNRKIG